MREILCRGKDADTGEWYQGGLYVEPAPPVCMEERQPDKVWIVLPNPRFCPDWGLPYQMVRSNVDPDTVGQYTGLTDKNSTKIFEGDIVRDDKGNVGHVEFLIQAAGYVIVWKHGDTSLGHRARGGGYDCDPSLEVIGNIYDNPELLEGGAEK